MRIESGAEKSRGLFVFRFRVLVGFFTIIWGMFFLMLWDHYYYAYCRFSLNNYTRSLSGFISYVFSVEGWMLLYYILFIISFL